MSIQKTGVVTTSLFVENEHIEQPFPGFNNYYSGTYTYSSTDKKYTVTSPSGSNSLGHGVCIKTNNVYLPYGVWYRISMEVYVPTQHSLQVDVNNYAVGVSSWAGNDNDNSDSRSYSLGIIPANTWKEISWKTCNISAKNTTQADICVYDGLGLVTTNDTDTTEWYIRNPKIEFFYASNNKFGISDDAIYANEFIEY